MARIPETFNFGDRETLTNEGLLLILQRMYEDLAIAINQKIELVQRPTDGQVGDTFLPQGTVNINLTTNKVEMLTNHVSAAAVTWTTLS
jgi:hypothetical protein